MRAGAIAAAVISGLIISAALVAVVVGLTRGGQGAEAFELRPVNPGGPVGLASREDARWRLVVWGLAPETRHRVEIGSGCRPGRPVAILDANANGVAYARFEAAEDPATLLVRTTAGPTAIVACGPRGPLRAADVASVGPGAAARTRASALLQLDDGGPRLLVRGRVGRELALGVRARRPGELRVLDLAAQIGPEIIARFSIVPRRAGTFPLRAHGETVGRLVVAP